MLSSLQLLHNDSKSMLISFPSSVTRVSPLTHFQRLCSESYAGGILKRPSPFKSVNGSEIHSNPDSSQSNCVL